VKAFCITAPGETAIRDVEEPVPGGDEVLLRVCVVGLCGSDLNTFRGTNPMVTYPRVPGHEISAVIESVGSRVADTWTPGTRVTVMPYTSCGACSACRRDRPNCCRDNQTLGVQCDGALADRIIVPQSKLFTSAKLNARELALVEPLTVGCHAVSRGGVTGVDTVAVLGCGAIGLGAVAAAAVAGARVVAVDIDDSKLALALEAGAVAGINSREDSLHARLRAITDDAGPDVVVEAVGRPETYRAAVDEVAFAGRVVYIGYAKKAVEYETKLFVQKELDVRGARNATREDFASVIRMLEQGRFPVDATISRTVSLANARAALRAWGEYPASVTKILVQVSAADR
jgi:threonine dehydrogenase-like Zn-dependent dehydrogenase